MNKGQFMARRILLKEKLSEKYGRLSRKQKRWIVAAIVLLILALLFTLRYLKLHKYDSVVKIETVFRQNETDIRHAAEVLTALPKHEDDDFPDLLIVPKDFDASGIGHVWSGDNCSIVSDGELTEQAYQSIFEAARPLFREMPMVCIAVSTDRSVVDFILWQQPYGPKALLSSFRACIVYDANAAFYNAETRDACDSRHARLHYERHYPGVTDVRQLEENWFAVTSE